MEARRCVFLFGDFERVKAGEGYDRIALIFCRSAAAAVICHPSLTAAAAAAAVLRTGRGEGGRRRG